MEAVDTVAGVMAADRVAGVAARRERNRLRDRAGEAAAAFTAEAAAIRVAAVEATRAVEAAGAAAATGNAGISETIFFP